MKRSPNGWMWSDGTAYSGQDILEQHTLSYEVVCIRKVKDLITFVARTMTHTAYAVCSKVGDQSNCEGMMSDGICYFKVIQNAYTWFQAHNECINKLATLAIFNNLSTSVSKLFDENDLYWVSLSRNTWRWERPGAAKVVTFNKWSTGHPYNFNSNNPNCATTNSDGSAWKVTDCSGTYHVVCMRGIDPSGQSTTSSSTTSNSTTTTSTTSTTSPMSSASNNPSDHDITNPSFLPAPANRSSTNEENSLSEGAKAGIGVGVCLLMIIIITIAAILIFKYFHQLRAYFMGKFGRKIDRKPLESENHYAEIVTRNNDNTSVNDVPTSIQYAELQLKNTSDDDN